MGHAFIGAMVSVVTDGLSDDANGVDLTGDNVWLQIYHPKEASCRL